MQKLGIFLSMLILPGCVHTVSIEQAVIAPELKFPLLSPNSFGKHLLLTQAGTLRFESKSYELLVYTEISSRSVSIVGIQPSGVRLFSIVYDGQEIQSEGLKGLSNVFKPEDLLANLQIALWPLTEVIEGFATKNICFNDGRCDFFESADHLGRKLRKDGNDILRISYEGMPYYKNDIEYENPGQHYRLHIETLSVEMLSGHTP